jgi:hypothetical protein
MPALKTKSGAREGAEALKNRREGDAQTGRLSGPTDLSETAALDIGAALDGHRHISGSHFCDYHLLLDEQGERIFAMTDPIAERARKVSCITLRSIGHIARFSASATTMRNTSTRRHRESSRGLDRRNRAANLVSVPRRRIDRPTRTVEGPANAASP